MPFGKQLSFQTPTYIDAAGATHRPSAHLRLSSQPKRASHQSTIRLPRSLQARIAPSATLRVGAVRLVQQSLLGYLPAILSLLDENIAVGLGVHLLPEHPQLAPELVALHLK